MLHHSTEISTDNGSTWAVVTSDEISGPGKTAVVSGLATGTYQVRLKITPLAGGSAVVSDAVPLTVSTGNVFNESVQALANVGVSAANIQAMTDALSAVATSSVTAAGTVTVTESIAAAITALATCVDSLQNAASYSESVTASAAAADSVSAAVNAVDSLTVTVGAVVSVAAIATMQDALMAAASAATSVVDQVAEPAVLTFNTGLMGATYTVNDPGPGTVEWTNTQDATGNGGGCLKISGGTYYDADAEDYLPVGINVNIPFAVMGATAIENLSLKYKGEGVVRSPYLNNGTIRTSGDLSGDATAAWSSETPTVVETIAASGSTGLNLSIIGPSSVIGNPNGTWTLYIDDIAMPAGWIQ